MTALVTKHLPLVAGTPDGIKKLRGLILDLATRGKLVAQDNNEEDARRVRIVVVPIELTNERAAMKDFSGSIRTSIQRQSGGQVVAA
jgi:hypothetical protein